MIDLSAFQRSVAQWVAHNFGEQHRGWEMVGLSEEVGELSRALLKQHQGIRGTREEWQAEAEKEIGDVLIKLASVATACGIDLESAVVYRWAEVRQRDFKADPIGHGMAQD